MFFSFLAIFNIKFLLGFIKNGILPQKLTNEEENNFITQLFDEKTHEKAREELISHNLRLVAHIAKKYASKDIDTEDFISIGTIGLIKAIDTYSLDKKVKLATYAAKCIDNEILMTIRNQKKYAKDVSLGEAIGLDKDGQEIKLIDVIPSTDRSLDESFDIKQTIKLMQGYLDVLDERELQIINLRYGLNGESEHTQKEISKLYEISRSYVSRIEKRALIKLLQEFKRHDNY